MLCRIEESDEAVGRGQSRALDVGREATPEDGGRHGASGVAKGVGVGEFQILS